MHRIYPKIITNNIGLAPNDKLAKKNICTMNLNVPLLINVEIDKLLGVSFIGPVDCYLGFLTLWLLQRVKII